MWEARRPARRPSLRTRVRLPATARMPVRHPGVPADQPFAPPLQQANAQPSFPTSAQVAVLADDAPTPSVPNSRLTATYLLENCGALRALWRPAFLRSTMRASRVRKPSRLSTRGARDPPRRGRARCRAAAPRPGRWGRRRECGPGCQSAPRRRPSEGPSPLVRRASRGKYDSSERPLIHVAPSPGRRSTRATDVLRLPVPGTARSHSSSGSGWGSGPRAGGRARVDLELGDLPPRQRFRGSIPLTAVRMTSVGRRSSCSASVRDLRPPG